jgi:hypothetical protein
LEEEAAEMEDAAPIMDENVPVKEINHAEMWWHASQQAFHTRSSKLEFTLCWKDNMPVQMK